MSGQTPKPVRTPFDFPQIEPMSPLARGIAQRIAKAGFTAYFVGGCVRDALLGHRPKDIDIATDAPPSAIEKIFRHTQPVGAAFGVMLVVEQGHPFEVTTFRTESGYADRRRPSEVAFSTPDQDVKRRDFTVNALFYDPEQGEILDYVDGRADLENRLLRAVGDPAERFDEDALRLMRAVRFAASYGFSIEERTWRALVERPKHLRDISRERIGDEWRRALTTADPQRFITLMHDSGLLRETWPELEPCRDRAIARWTMLRSEALRKPTDDPVALATILRSIGGETVTRMLWAAVATAVEPPKQPREAVHAIGSRFAWDNPTKSLVQSAWLGWAEWHSLGSQPLWRQRELLGLAGAQLLLALVALDAVDRIAAAAAIEQVRALMLRYPTREAIFPPPLIDGADLMALGLKPGPKMGELLRTIRQAQLDDLVTNKDGALAMAQDAVKKST